MTDVNATNSLVNDLLVNNKFKAEEKPANELGQKAFLKLMITQLENQDPLSPAENSEFIAQLAQFSSVESLDQLNSNFDSFADSFVGNQALQASTLVGRSVTVPSDSTRLYASDVITASADLPVSTSSVAIDIYDESGSLVEQIATGPMEAGEVILRWDGQQAEVNGEMLDWQSSHDQGLPPGDYSFKISTMIDGENTGLDTFVSANVNSVTVGQNGTLTLNLAGIGAVSLANVKQFN